MGSAASIQRRQRPRPQRPDLRIDEKNSRVVSLQANVEQNVPPTSSKSRQQQTDIQERCPAQDLTLFDFMESGKPGKRSENWQVM
ncbi:hypothetical protein HK100_000589, partial [Physocladia obscura]